MSPEPAHPRTSPGSGGRGRDPVQAGNWRAFRPAIWLAMLGIALILLVNPPYFGVVLLGAAIGIALRVRTRRRRPARGASVRRTRRR